MNILKSLFAALVGLSLLTSCGTVNHVNGTIILGSWKFVKVVTYIPSSTEAAQTLNMASSLENETKSSSSETNKESIEIKQLIKKSVWENDYSALFARFPELITAIEFKGDKTATVTSQQSTTTGTWKIDKTGTKIKIKAADTKRITPIEIRNVDFTLLEIYDPLAEGNFILQFKKQP
ncbi:MAG: hypothetical protein WCO93_07790 [bacterium]